MNYPDLTDGVDYRFTLFRVESGEKKKENLNRKFTKSDRSEFLEKCREDPEVDLQNLENSVVMKEEIKAHIVPAEEVIANEMLTQTTQEFDR